MEISVLKKKLSTFLTEGGYLKNVSEEVLYELLISWEEWEGNAKEFYRSVGYSDKKLAGLIGKAKKLKREGYFGNENFKELIVESHDPEQVTSTCGKLIEVESNGKLIRFPQVGQLLEYLKKAG